MSFLSILLPYYGYETNKYSNTYEFQRGKVTTTTTRVHTQITMSGQRGREAEPRDQKYGNAVKQEEGGILANAVPYFNPKYGRRSEAYFDFLGNIQYSLSLFLFQCNITESFCLLTMMPF